MLKKYPRVKLQLAALDYFLLLLALTVSFYLRYKTDLFGSLKTFPWTKFMMYALVLFSFPIIFRINNLYKQRIFLSAFAQFIQLVKSLLLLGAIYVSVIFLFRYFLIEHSRSLVSFFLIFATVFLVLGRIIIFRNIHKHEGIQKRRIIVIGAGKRGSELLAKIKEIPIENIEVVSFFDDDIKKKGKTILGVPILGTTDDLELYLKKLKINIDGIYISINSVNYDKLIELINRCKIFGYPVYLNSEYFRVINDRLNIQEFESLLSPVLYGNSGFFYSKYLKRFTDISLSALLLIILSPLFLLTAILIKITSKGPVFYKAKVLGKNEKEFIWFKFRTMKIHQDTSQHDKFMVEMIKNKKKEEILKIKADKRVTKIGRFLRKFSIDELPQLINVLKGEMSLIGPRPCSLFEYSLYEEWHKKRFLLTPGITGLWQAFGRSAVSYDDMVIMDLYYIENLSFWLDLKIIIKTIPTVFFGKGAY